MSSPTTPFRSILFRAPEDAAAPGAEPALMHDLNLDRLVAALTAGRDEYDLAPFFSTRLRDRDAILYRQEVMQDLERAPVIASVQRFAGGMRTVRAHLAGSRKARFEHEKERWVLAAAECYCDAVEQLADALAGLDVRSRGLGALRGYLAEYARSDAFAALAGRARKLASDLAAIRYALLIQGNRVNVRRFEGEIDYASVVEDTFARFRRGAGTEYHFKLQSWGGMNPVEAQVLDRVALLHPEVFEALAAFCADHVEFVDARVAAFDREVQFYVAYLEFTGDLRRAGLAFCYPEIAEDRDDVRSSCAFDIALAHALVRSGRPVVTNDFHLRAPERVFVVSGPNQGGKTTFARMFGQLHHLATLGCPVPGSSARLLLYDELFTHFEREEDVRSLRGKLQDELIRIREILERATPRSIVIMNESFSSTTLKDAVFLTREVMARISALDLLCVCVTFLEEVASFDEKTVSVVSTVDPANPALRTYKLVRRRADGLSYALSIAEKHRVTYRWLTQRIPS